MCISSNRNKNRNITTIVSITKFPHLYPQVRFSPNSLSDLCHILTAELVKRGSHTAIRGISIMVRAVRKLQVRLHSVMVATDN